MKGNPLCSHVTTAFSSDRAGAGADASSPRKKNPKSAWIKCIIWEANPKSYKLPSHFSPPSSLLLRLSAEDAEWSRAERCCPDWWKWWWWWWWWCWAGRGRNAAFSARWEPSSRDKVVIWMKTSGGDPRTSPAAWNGAEVTELADTPTRPEKSCWGEVEDSGFKQSNTPPSSRLLSDPSVWLLFLGL